MTMLDEINDDTTPDGHDGADAYPYHLDRYLTLPWAEATGVALIDMTDDEAVASFMGYLAHHPVATLTESEQAAASALLDVLYFRANPAIGEFVRARRPGEFLQEERRIPDLPVYAHTRVTKLPEEFVNGETGESVPYVIRRAPLAWLGDLRKYRSKPSL